MEPRAEFERALTQALTALGLAADSTQREKMFAHYELVVEANRRFNLTRITAPGEAAVKHYSDSLVVLSIPGFQEKALRVVDVGTGAGFPAVPLAIMCPQWQMLAIDGTGKKAAFVGECADRLGLANLRARHARGADLARETDAVFDVVLLRAVTKLADGLREVQRLIAPGGAVVFYKTPHLEPAEVRAAAAAASKLKLMPEPPLECTLPCVDGSSLARLLIVYRRQA